jgi:hypothetical protein
VTTSQPLNPKPSNSLTHTTLATDQHSNTENTPLAASSEKAPRKFRSKAAG